MRASPLRAVAHRAAREARASAGSACRMEPASSRTLARSRVGGAPRRLAADGEPARGPCAAAIGRRRGVAADHAHIRSPPSPSRSATIWAMRRMGPLAELDHRGHAAHRARRLQPHRGAVLGTRYARPTGRNRRAPPRSSPGRWRPRCRARPRLARAALSCSGAQTPRSPSWRPACRGIGRGLRRPDREPARGLSAGSPRPPSSCAGAARPGSIPAACAAQSSSCSATAQAIGWPTARYMPARRLVEERDPAAARRNSALA